MRLKLEINVNDSHGIIGNVGDAIEALRCVANQLETRYGYGGALGTNIDRSITVDGQVVGRCAVVQGAAWQEVPGFPSWLAEAVLSMEHDHNPAVRYCGDQLRKRMEGK